jgi:hypothetical protein
MRVETMKLNIALSIVDRLEYGGANPGVPDRYVDAGVRLVRVRKRSQQNQTPSDRLIRVMMKLRRVEVRVNGWTRDDSGKGQE